VLVYMLMREKVSFFSSAIKHIMVVINRKGPYTPFCLFA
jgi:hypothetical protein